MVGAYTPTMNTTFPAITSTKGLTADVYRNGFDCTNNGVTAQAKDVLVLGSYDARRIPSVGTTPKFTPMDQVFDAHPNRRAVAIIKDMCCGQERIRAVPVGVDGQPVTYGMFGGNFIYTSDSRLREVAAYPIPVHDRFEANTTGAAPEVL